MEYALRARARAAAGRGRVALGFFWLRTAAHALVMGGVERLRVGGGPAEWIGGAGHEFRVAARRLAASPGFSLATIATLALGLGATTAIHAVVHAVLLAPLPHPAADRLVWIGHAAPGADIERLGASFGTYVHYREHRTGLEALAIYSAREMTLAGETPVRIFGARVSHELFDLLLEAPAPVGRWIQPADDLPGAAPVAVVSHALWQGRYAGRPDIVGQVEVIDAMPVEVVGVLPPGFRFLDYAPDVLLAARIDPAEVPLGTFSHHLIGRMRPGVTPDDVGRDLVASLPAMEQRFNAVAYEGLVVDGQLQPIVEPLKETLVGSVERTLWILLGTVGMVLAIACANVANLFLVRAEARRRESWVRKALGASRWRVARTFLAESLLLATAGAILGLTAATIGTGPLREHGPQTLPRLHTVGIGSEVVATATLLAVGVALVLGALAGLGVRSRNLAEGIDDGGRGSTAGRRSRRVRRALVVGQVALSLVLLVGAGLMLRSYRLLGQVDPGFDPEGALTFRIALSRSDYPTDIEAARFQHEFTAALRSLPGVTAAGAVGCVPLSGCNALNPVYAEGQALEPERLPPAVNVLAAGAGAFEALRIPVLEGREFTAADVGASTALVSASVARRLWPGASAIGRRIQPDLPDETMGYYTVVGVLGDHHAGRLVDGPSEHVYLSLAGNFPYMASPYRVSYVVRTRGEPVERVPAVRDLLRRLDASVPPVEMRAMTDLVARDRAATSFVTTLLLIAGIASLVLGMVGVYGVLAYTVAQRAGEIGIRMALGARGGDVRRLVTREGMALVGLGILLGTGAAIALGRWLAALLYGVSPTDPATYVVVAIVLAAVAFLAAWIPARRAAGVSPVDSLRAA